MGRNFRDYLKVVGTSLVIGFSSPYHIPNAFADQKWYEVERVDPAEVKRRKEMMNHPIQTYNEATKRFDAFGKTPEGREWAKDAAGKVLEDIHKIPHAREAIEWMDQQDQKDKQRRR